MQPEDPLCITFLCRFGPDAAGGDSPDSQMSVHDSANSFGNAGKAHFRKAYSQGAHPARTNHNREANKASPSGRQTKLSMHRLRRKMPSLALGQTGRSVSLGPAKLLICLTLLAHAMAQLPPQMWVAHQQFPHPQTFQVNTESFTGMHLTVSPTKWLHSTCYATWDP